jgi:hypothetical protein
MVNLLGGKGDLQMRVNGFTHDPEPTIEAATTLFQDR